LLLCDVIFTVNDGRDDAKLPLVVGRDGAEVVVAPSVLVVVKDAPFSTGDGGSSSSSDSESSLSDCSPTVDGLLASESGLSGPSCSPYPSFSSPSETGIALATASPRRTRFEMTFTGDGLRS
jgi:hypothetical protein